MCAIFCSFGGIYDEKIQQQSNILCHNGTGINLTKKKSTQKIWQKKQTNLHAFAQTGTEKIRLCSCARGRKKNTQSKCLQKYIYIYLYYAILLGLKSHNRCK